VAQKRWALQFDTTQNSAIPKFAFRNAKSVTGSPANPQPTPAENSDYWLLFKTV
jgi:hypothetical protein